MQKDGQYEPPVEETPNDNVSECSQDSSKIESAKNNELNNLLVAAEAKNKTVIDIQQLREHFILQNR